MQINDLIIFQSVAEQGSFTKAAAATNTVQSNVTARIKFLEAEFNSKLFERTSRTIALTDAGAELLKTAKEILLLIDNTRKNISGNEGAMKGMVRIGCIHTTAALRIPGILQVFSDSYPDVEFKLKTGTSASLIKEVLNCQLNGAFVAGKVEDERLLVQPVATEELAIITSGLLASLDLLKLSGKKLKLIVFADGCSYRKHFERIVQDWPSNKISLIEMDTLEGIINAVENNLGVTLLPAALIEKHYRFKDLKAFKLPAELAHMETVFIKRKDTAMSLAYQKFFELIARGYAT